MIGIFSIHIKIHLMRSNHVWILYQLKGNNENVIAPVRGF